MSDDSLWLCIVRETKVYAIDLFYTPSEKKFTLIHICKDLLRDKIENIFEYAVSVSLDQVKETSTILNGMITKLQFDAEEYLRDNNIQPNYFDSGLWVSEIDEKGTQVIYTKEYE